MNWKALWITLFIVSIILGSFALIIALIFFLSHLGKLGEYIALGIIAFGIIGLFTWHIYEEVTTWRL